MPGVEQENNTCWLFQLPEDCLRRIVQFLSPVESCIAAVVCKALRIVVDSDQYWETKLPALADRSQNLPSKKYLYLRLRNGIIQKDLSQPYWLDPDSGEGCYVVQSRALRIVWSDDQRYWKWIKHPSSWSSQVAYLNSVCWFEVSGLCEIEFLPGEYAVSFRVMLTSDLYGWNGTPVDFRLSASDGYSTESQRFVGDNESMAPLRVLDPWIELDIGVIKVTEKKKLKLEFGMTEIAGGMWKRGLIVDCVKIQPCSAIRGLAVT